MNSDYFKNKVILVTGAAGSIGTELVKQLLRLDPKVIRCLDINETELFYLEQRFRSDKLRIFIGDIRDEKRLELALENVDIIFHAAALKHVPLCENNPFEAIKTNIVGTQNLIQVARAANVKKIITISTDKAINPTNVMGATKLLAERLTIAANLYIGDRNISYSTVRFGNVLGSRGSILPLLFNQIRDGGPVTLTDPKMTRYIMRIDDAVKLVLKAAILSKGGEIFILEMPSVSTGDLIDAVIEEVAPRFGFSSKDIKVKNIGSRAGEKIHEELISEYEITSSFSLKNEAIYILIPKNESYHSKILIEHHKAQGAIILTNETKILHSSANAVKLSKEDIISLIKTIIDEYPRDNLFK